MTRASAFLPSLGALGFAHDRATALAAMYAHADTLLDAMGSAAASRVSVWSPGRIEVFGKHTDYAGGRSLLVAVDRGFCVRVLPRHDAMVRVTGEDWSAGRVTGAAAYQCEFPLVATTTAPDGHWSNYVATVVARLAANFPEATTGADIAFVSDLPPAAGASSSSALMIAIFRAIVAVNALDATERWRAALPTREALAGYLGAVEMGGAYGPLAGRDGVGTLGGAQDQTAILCADAGHVVDYGWIPVRRIGAYAMPSSLRFVVAASGVVAEKSAGARARYNRVSRMVTHLLAAWNRSMGRTDASLAVAAESSSVAHARLRELCDEAATAEFPAEALRARLEQFLLETYTLIPAAAAALGTHDWAIFGDTAVRSQQAAEQGLANQVPETSALVRVARAHGAVAASAFGAGFGGSVWALVPTSALAAGSNGFLARWSAAYAEEFPERGTLAMFFETSAGPAAQCWPDDAHGLHLGLHQ